MKPLISTALAAAAFLAIAPMTAQAAPVSGLAQAGEAPLVEKVHSDRWRAIARSGQRFNGPRRGYYGGPHYGGPRHGGPRYGRHHGYGQPPAYGQRNLWYTPGRGYHRGPSW